MIWPQSQLLFNSPRRPHRRSKIQEIRLCVRNLPLLHLGKRREVIWILYGNDNYLVHFTGQDLLPRGKGHNRTPRSLTGCPTSPTPHSHSYPRRLESLTICRWNYGGSTFLLSYLKTLSVGPVGVSNSRPLASQPSAQPSEPPGILTRKIAIKRGRLRRCSCF